MHLLVGLGNPGKKYLTTRHNIGFLVIDALASHFGDGNDDGHYKQEHKAHTQKVRIGNASCLLVKPQTYMNLSGEAVSALMNYYKITPEKLIVIHDDVDLSFDEFRFQTARGHGGNNGISSIHKELGTKDYDRLKVGIGRPSGRKDVSAHVLENFNDAEMQIMPTLISNLCDALCFYVDQGLEKTANEFNEKGNPS